jgi:hypothetical protein
MRTGIRQFRAALAPAQSAPAGSEHPDQDLLCAVAGSSDRPSCSTKGIKVMDCDGIDGIDAVIARLHRDGVKIWCRAMTFGPQ